MLNPLKIRTHAALTALVLLSAPALAGAQTTSSAAPVTVQAVHTHNGQADFEAGGHTNEANTVDVHFQNTASKAIARVVFDVRSGSDNRGTIVDVGQFAPGAEIVRHYENTFDDLAPLTNANVAPVEVDFTDGSVWKATD
jgi:hypothetical protein